MYKNVLCIFWYTNSMKFINFQTSHVIADLPINTNSLSCKKGDFSFQWCSESELSSLPSLHKDWSMLLPSLLNIWNMLNKESKVRFLVVIQLNTWLFISLSNLACDRYWVGFLSCKKLSFSCIWNKHSGKERKAIGKVEGSNHCGLLDPATLLFPFSFFLPKSLIQILP